MQNSARMKPYSVDKSPAAYDEYKFTLPELYRELAKEELREDDAVRENALAEMRIWIVKNPHIRKCRTDAKFLLRFLRFRQFSVPMACEALERYLAIRALYPSLFKNLDCNETVMKELVGYEPLTYLGQDHTGRAVYLYRFGMFNGEKHSALQDARYIVLILETILEWEESQIGGLHVLLDYDGCTMSNFEKWGTSDLKLIMEVYSQSYPLRFSEIHSTQLQKFGIPVVETLVSFANPKLREKITCYKTVAELEKHFEPALKPTVYGGEANLDELNRAFRKRIEEQREITLGLDDMEIDVEHYAAVWAFEESSPTDEISGALFKQLNIM
ncbi:retinaldehyde-binding protein 1-like [Anopheles nili]|uniref:retinaldehyde-binding protein 1-like n=1 Tax=Anopheles nili TaxID=185578 RepID=UPI00237BA448|nr:retinaldehyde-binding protein 1-like [Anopheles nili]